MTNSLTPYTWICGFFLQLNLQLPYLLHSQGDDYTVPWCLKNNLKVETKLPVLCYPEKLYLDFILKECIYFFQCLLLKKSCILNNGDFLLYSSCYVIKYKLKKIAPLFFDEKPESFKYKIRLVLLLNGSSLNFSIRVDSEEFAPKNKVFHACWYVNVF